VNVSHQGDEAITIKGDRNLRENERRREPGREIKEEGERGRERERGGGGEGGAGESRW